MFDERATNGLQTVAADGSVEAPTRVYDRLLADIIAGRLAAGSRLKVANLAATYGTSTNPVREALQQLRGEGFVVIEANRGAHVRRIDEGFVRDMYEITSLIEPYLVGWFVDYARPADIARMEEIQSRIETIDADDSEGYSSLDEAFHRVGYDQHYNRNAAELWLRYRNTLRTISREMRIGRSRHAARQTEHLELIDCLRRHDRAGAMETIRAHVQGAGRHIVDLMRAGSTARS